MKEKEIKCPNCGENLAKIIYGLVPDPGEALKKKKVFIGGCMISDNDPITLEKWIIDFENSLKGQN